MNLLNSIILPQSTGKTGLESGKILAIATTKKIKVIKGPTLISTSVS